MRTIAALYVDHIGCYADQPFIDAWPEQRDARKYCGPHPVVAHPPCQRWGRFWHGSPSNPHQHKKGQDAGCFAAALTAVRNFGGVLEHPKDSHAWDWFGMEKPNSRGGWSSPDMFGGRSCCVWQGHYGHFAGKATWLYCVGRHYPELIWGKCEQRLCPVALERHGYEKARRQGIMASIGGKEKTRIRNATPIQFRDLLLDIARNS